MDKKICRIIALMLLVCCMLQTTVFADEIMLLNNNTSLTRTVFSISDVGEARVTVYFEGYPNVTTNATISIKIEKRTLLLFWSDIVDDTISVTGESYFDELTYQLEDTGTYRCTVEYVISGTGGAADMLTFEDEAEYK